MSNRKTRSPPERKGVEEGSPMEDNACDRGRTRMSSVGVGREDGQGRVVPVP